jgi:DNA polymerase-3 subunit gamma/tau
VAYQSLYRRYRSRRFGELRGQAPIVTALRNAVRENRVGHAYLFSGPRGTGKTSTARILAKVLNCANVVDGEPCLECASCVAIEAGTSFDVHELDAASNRGIDDIRRLIESAALASPGRTKLYILDEVHMLTEPAENALLKTLEEPPENVVFVLATTDPQKVRPTIRSRTQHFEFHLLPAAELGEHIRWVAADAGLDVDDDGIEHALRSGGGSARDTLTALEQVAAAGGVAERIVSVDDLIEALADRDPGRALVAVAEAMGAGREPRVLGEQLVARLRDVFLAAMKAPLDHLSDTDRGRVAVLVERFERPFITRSIEVLGEALSLMPEAADRRIVLETALVRLADAQSDTSLGALLERVDRLERRLADSAPAPPVAPVAAPAPVRANTAAPAPVSAPPAPTSTVGDLPTRDELTLAWGDSVLTSLPRVVKARYSGGRFVGVANGRAQFALSNEATVKRCEEMRADVEAALGEHFGRAVPLALVVEGSASAPPPAVAEVEADEEIVVDVHELDDAPVDHRTSIDRIAEAFPGAELLQEDAGP